ncbi:MAG: exosortase C-terminal domain/associated protein EpsI, partial [Paracoccaceae bacterium]
EYLEGFTHFFEGWVIFMICVVLLFILAWIMLRFTAEKMSLVDALDLDTSGWATQLTRVRLIEPSKALIAAALIVGTAATAWQMRPDVGAKMVDREPFVLFPTQLGNWKAGIPQTLAQSIEGVLGADDYHSVQFRNPDEAAEVGLFIAWYEDQTKGGTHSPEVCLPGAGWEIAWLERIDLAPEVGYDEPFNINRAVIQKGQVRMMAYYWFEQHGRHVAWDFEAKMYLLWDGVTIGRTDGALVRLTTPIGRDETEADAEARLQAMFLETNAVLQRFVPGL